MYFNTISVSCKFIILRSVGKTWFLESGKHFKEVKLSNNLEIMNQTLIKNLCSFPQTFQLECRLLSAGKYMFKVIHGNTRFFLFITMCAT